MLGYLILLFTFVPMIELYFLIRVGHSIGAMNTVIIVIVTGVLGAVFAKMEGLRVLSRMQQSIESGAMPASELFDGVLILVGGILLITPGILTDIIGFIFIMPFTRHFLKKWIRQKIQETIDQKNDVITVQNYHSE